MSDPQPLWMDRKRQREADAADLKIWDEQSRARTIEAAEIANHIDDARDAYADGYMATPCFCHHCVASREAQ